MPWSLRDSLLQIEGQRRHEERENSGVNKTEMNIREAIMLGKLQSETQEQLGYQMPWDSILKSGLEANLESSRWRNGISISVFAIHFLMQH